MKSRVLIAVILSSVWMSTSSWNPAIAGDGLLSLVEAIDAAKGTGTANLNEGTFETEITGMPVTWIIPKGAYIDFRFEYANGRLGKSALEFLRPKNVGPVRIQLGNPVHFEGSLQSVAFDGTQITIESTVAPIKGVSGTSPRLTSTRAHNQPLITVHGKRSPIKDVAFTNKMQFPVLELQFGTEVPESTALAFPGGALIKGSKFKFSDVRYIVAEQKLSCQIDSLTIPSANAPLNFPGKTFEFKVSDW